MSPVAVIHEETPWDSTVRRDLAVGRTVGEYVIVRRIGEGGMGIVYEAEHPPIGRRVAIKVLRPDGGGERDLLGEARAVSVIRHRHIIDVFGFGQLDGLGQYLVMDFLEGVPLDEEIRKSAPMTHDVVIPILDDTLAALAAAHAKGVIHRDLKPGNLFLVQESSGTRYVKVLDFGLAKATGPMKNAAPKTREGITMGTPEYMAPEQAQARRVDGRTDLYSLGIIAFEMLTGRVPFMAETPLAVAMSQVVDAPPKPRSLEQSIPRALEGLVMKLLAKDPDDRPASAEDVRAELKRIRDGLSTESTMVGVPSKPVEAPAPKRDTQPDPTPPPTLPQLQPASRRKTPPLVFGLAGAFVALIVAVVAIALSQDPVKAPAPSRHEPDDAQGRAMPAPPGPYPVAPPPAVQPTPMVAPTREPAAIAPPPKPRPVQKRGPPGTLRVVSRGCSMSVMLDGKEVGSTPYKQPAESGVHRLKLSNPACKTPTFERQIVIRPNEELLIDAQQP